MMQEMHFGSNVVRGEFRGSKLPLLAVLFLTQKTQKKWLLLLIMFCLVISLLQKLIIKNAPPFNCCNDKMNVFEMKD